MIEADKLSSDPIQTDSEAFDKRNLSPECDNFVTLGVFSGPISTTKIFTQSAEVEGEPENAPRRRRSKEERAAIISAFLRSGQTRQAFRLGNGLRIKKVVECVERMPPQ